MQLKYIDIPFLLIYTDRSHLNKETVLVRGGIEMKNRIIAVILLLTFILPTVTSCDKSHEDDLKRFRLEENPELLGGMGSLITDEYEGYLGYGYNVAKSSYFNAGDVSTRAEILKTDMLKDDRRLYKQDLSSTETSLYMGETLESYQKDVASNLGLSFSYGLFSKIKGDFSLSATMNTSDMTKSVFIKNQIKIKKQRQFINWSDLEVEELYAYTNKKFLKALNADVSAKTDDEKQKYYAEKIFDIYGTHILMDIMLGGRLDLNYVYRNTSQETTEDIKAALNATYQTLSAKISGSVSTEISEKAKKFAENSTFTATRLGGTVAPDISTYEKVLNEYKEWSQSIEDNKNLYFFDVGNSCQDSLLPVWEFANSEEKRTEIILAYEKYVSNVGKFFADVDKSINKESMPLYIKNIYVGSNTVDDVAKSDIDKQIAMHEPDYLKKVILSFDLNKKAGGNYIYIGYTLTDNPDEAITDIRVQQYASMDKNVITKTNDGYTYIFADLNDGIRKDGSAAYIVMYYSRDKGKGGPIKEIGIETDGTYSFGSASTGWIPCIGFHRDMLTNCNYGVPGSSKIYVWQKR